MEKEKLYRGKSVIQCQVDGGTRQKILKLVGDRPKISCFLDDVKEELLWDTGSMVSLVDRSWAKEHFPEKEILPASLFLDGGDLKLSAANSSEIKFDGVVLLDFGLEKGKPKFAVPVLVSSRTIPQPILGFNVIEYLVVHGDAEDHDLLQNCFVTGHPFKIKPLVSLLQKKASDPDFITEVRVPAEVVVPAGHRKQVRCRVKGAVSEDNQAVYFSPKFDDSDDVTLLETVSQLRRGRTNYVHVEVLNETCKDKILRKGSVLGSVHSVSAVIPMLKYVNVGSLGVLGGKKKDIGVVGGVCAGSDEDSVGGTKGLKEGSDDWIPDADLSHLNEGQQKVVLQVLIEEKDVFSRSECDIGDIPDFKMKIPLADDIPVKEPYRKIPRNLYSEVKHYINDLLTNGWIRESCSSYSSPIVCVRKKDGTLRMCCDYRKLNGKTVADCQPIPRIQDILDGLVGKRWFSTLDMSKAYHQGYIDEASRHVTAFATPWTLYEWIRIPFGLRNAPPAFQRHMNVLLGDLKGSICDPYLDDVLCYADLFEEGVEGLRNVLRRLKSKGVKLRASKCEFLKPEVRYLGRLVSGDGFRMDPKDTEALERFREPPQTVGELRSLLGLLGYYRCYVRNFASKVKPLYDLLKCDTTVKSKGKVKKGNSGVGQKYDAKEKIDWNSDLQKVVDSLIDHLKSGEVIAYPDFEKPFFMTCDASNLGLGAVLYQRQGDVDRVISYASRTLTDAENNYNLHSGKLEFLALKWAITERFADYLRYSPEKFIVFTDNNPLTYVLTTAKLNATGLRWVADLAEFDFSIKYRPGKENVDADSLSRRPLELSELEKKCTESVDPSSVAAVMSSSNVCGVDVMGSVCHLDVSLCELAVPSDEVLHVSKDELVSEQAADPVIGPVCGYVLSGRKPNRLGWSDLSRESKILMKSFNKLKMIDGVLIRNTAKYQQIVLPQKFHSLVFVELHEKMAHVGPEKVLDLAQQRFYWPRMSNDIEHYIRRKCRCIVTKKPNVSDKAPLVPILASSPFQMVSLDFLKLDKCQGGFEYVLVVIDHFTRFCQLYPTRSKSSQAAAAKMWNEFIPHFGFPEKIHHDQGPEFNSNLWKELHRFSGVKASNTTPYHPMGDGMTERLNRTVLNMLKAIPEKDKRRWKDKLPMLAFVYNSTVNKSTGYSPFFLMFGRNSRLPVDRMFGLDSSAATDVSRKTHSQFVEDWKASMEQAYQLANQNIEKAAGYNKEHYDKNTRGVDLKIGDKVLVRNMREKGGTGKLRSYWERGVFDVIDKKKDLPVYVVRNAFKEKDQRTLHRNMLMECNDLPNDTFQETEKHNSAKIVKVSNRQPSEEDDINETDDVGIYLHEDVDNFSSGGGSDDATADEPEAAMIPDENGGTDVDVVPEVPADVVESETVGSEAAEVDNMLQPTRRSSRPSRPRKIFSYHEVGGPPVLVDVNR